MGKTEKYKHQQWVFHEKESHYHYSVESLCSLLRLPSVAVVVDVVGTSAAVLTLQKKDRQNV